MYENNYVSYLEAPTFDTNQLHTAVVELVTMKERDLSTVETVHLVMKRTRWYLQFCNQAWQMCW